MGELARFILSVLLLGVVVTAGASFAGWWLAAGRRTERALRKRLGGRADALAVAPEAGRGVAVRAELDRLAVVRFRGDPGLLYSLAELRGAELLVDGEVKARVARGESRRPLDRVDAGAGSHIALRVILDDPADPAFELDLWRPDHRVRPGWTAEDALRDARAVFARLEAALQRSPAGIGRDR